VLDTSIFTVPVERIDRAMVKAFLAEQASERLFVESTTVEFKSAISGRNVVEAICAMANTDGGLVFVGVDEKTPAHCPGVDPGDLDKLINQCRTMLQPTFYPEVTPVAADDLHRVILVVRVNAEVDLQPVFCGTNCYLRVPGSTVRAGRDQTVALIRAQPQYAVAPFTGGGMALSSTYYPQSASGAPDEQLPPDLRLRAAGAVHLRPETRRRIVLGTPLRRAVSDAVDSSGLLRWARGLHARDDTGGWLTQIATELQWRQTRALARRYEPFDVTAVVEARAEGSRLSWCVDIDILDPEFRRARSEDRHGGIMSAEHMVRGWMEAANLVTSTLPALVGEHLASPPASTVDAVLWSMPAQRDLRWAINLDRLPRDTESRPLGEGQLILDATEGDATPAILDWLQRALLNDGVTNAEDVATETVEKARNLTDDGPWLS
jgi:hypothetical protein